MKPNKRKASDAKTDKRDKRGASRDMNAPKRKKGKREDSGKKSKSTKVPDMLQKFLEESKEHHKAI